MFMNENICTLVDLFDMAVAEGVSHTSITVVGRGQAWAEAKCC